MLGQTILWDVVKQLRPRSWHVHSEHRVLKMVCHNTDAVCWDCLKAFFRRQDICPTCHRGDLSTRVKEGVLEVRGRSCHL